MNIERLNILANCLFCVPDEKFHIGSWVDDNYRDFPQDATAAAILSHPCGTTACALGWACTIPEFVAEGLEYSYGFNYVTHKSFESLVVKSEISSIRQSLKTAMFFFNLTEEQARWLFMPDDYDCFGVWEKTGTPTPKFVGQRIRVLIHDKGEIIKRGIN